MSDVKLYVYDLSKGLAKQMSLMLTGKQIDGIWHTSVVAFGREIFFGQGILEARPGTTHHGQPLQVIDCGHTEIDENTFEEYLSSLKELYTADRYHLIDFNCNHFTADVVGFLTGATIPSWISGLPTEFLSTPFGQAMRPQIDAMFKRTAPTEHLVNSPNAPPPPSSPTPEGSAGAAPNGLAAALLSSVAAQATTGTNGTGPSASRTAPQTSATTTDSVPPPANPTLETSPLTLVTSLANFNSVLKQHQAVIANFTNTQGCAPCRAIKPVYESLAAEYAPTFGVKGARFVEVELGVGQGREIASLHNISATPTFIFYRDGKKADELRGASKKELETKVLDFLDSVWPMHPHRKTYLAGLERIPISPITSANVPKYPALIDKIKSFGVGGEDLAVLKDQVVPLLEKRGSAQASQIRPAIEAWMHVTDKLMLSLKPEEIFPIIDLLRIGIVDNQIATTFALQLSYRASNPLEPIFNITSSLLHSKGPATPKPLLLTVLRLLTNLLAVLPLAHLVLKSSQDAVTAITVESLLHADSGVRSAAAGVAFNLAGVRHRDAKQRSTLAEESEEQNWEVELASALVEGIAREADEDVAHRLLAALGLTLFLARGYEESLKPLLEVLEAKSTLENKAKSYKNKDIKKLALNIAVVC